MKKQNQHEKVYDFILANIIDRTYRPGMSLREVKIADELGMSPTPIREAFKHLEKDGWVTIEPYCGCCVRKFTEKELNECFMLREVLETFAVSEAVKNATEEDLARIKRALDQEEEFIKTLSDYSDDDRIEHSTATELDYHSALIAASHIDIIKEKLDIVKLQINSIGYIPGYKFTVKEIKKTQKQHYMIYEAIKNGWESSAAALIQEHLSKARENLKERYEFEYGE